MLNKDVYEMQVWEEEGSTEKLTLCGEPSGVGVAYKITKKLNIWNNLLGKP